MNEDEEVETVEADEVIGPNSLSAGEQDQQRIGRLRGARAHESTEDQKNELRRRVHHQQKGDYVRVHYTLRTKP